MKLIAIISAVVLVCAYAVENDDLFQQYTEFQNKFGKTYRSPLEAQERFSIFKTNMKLIEAHNKLFQEGKTTYTMGINQFSDWTQSEFENYLNGGLVLDTVKADEVFAKTPGFVVPESVDWRKEGIVTGVKNQAGCGSCWAFSATGALEGQYAKNTGQLVSLSEQNLIDCAWDEGNYACFGGSAPYAFEYVKINGIDSEKDYPYFANNGTCRADQYPTVTKVSSYVQIPEGDEEALVEAIARQGPISVALDGASFAAYQSGIFSGPCNSSSLNHAVVAVGYGSENGNEFYIMKNSWADYWGENGYIRIARNSNNLCGLSSWAFYPNL